MSIIYTDSIIKPNSFYEVQPTSKFPSQKSFLIGKRVIVQSIENTTVSVRQGSSSPHYIPLRSLYSVVGYTVKSVHAKNADGFIVNHVNDYKIVQGTAYLEPTDVTETHAIFTIDGKELKLPLSILIALVRNKVKVKDKTIRKEAKKSGVPVSVIEAVAGAIKVPPITVLPSAVTKMLPNLNIPVLIDTIKNMDTEVFDFNGDVHSNVQSALLANEKFIHALIQKSVMVEVSKLLNSQFKEIRDETI